MSDYNYDSLESEAKLIGNAFQIHKMMKETAFNSTRLISFFEKIFVSYKTYVQDYYLSYYKQNTPELDDLKIQIRTLDAILETLCKEKTKIENERILS